MTTQKINTPAPGLYPSSDVTKVIPTTQPHGIYFALRYLYDTYKDVNDWYNIKKSGVITILGKLLTLETVSNK